MLDEPSPPQRELLRDPRYFVRTLFETTPRLLVTPLLIAVNVGLWIWQVTHGVSAMTPSTGDLLAWGGDNAGLATHGEWWRLFTAMFLHAGLIHVGSNMYVLAQGGRYVERIFGPFAFAVLYLVSGLFGSVASLLAHPTIAVGVGASGAVFGVFGGLAGYLVVERRFVPRSVLVALRRSLVEFVGLNLLIGLAVPQIDLAAHGGGLVAGILCGAALARPLDAGTRSRVLRALVVLVLSVALLTGATRLIPLAPLPPGLPPGSLT